MNKQQAMRAILKFSFPDQNVERFMEAGQSSGSGYYRVIHDLLSAQIASTATIEESELDDYVIRFCDELGDRIKTMARAHQTVSKAVLRINVKRVQVARRQAQSAHRRGARNSIWVQTCECSECLDFRRAQRDQGASREAAEP